jgi:polyhydroxybutyrate depolymerase
MITLTLKRIVPTVSQHLTLGAIALLVLTLTSCGGSDSAPPPDTNTQVLRYVDQTITVDGRTRTYTLNLPPSYAISTSARVPLVVALHGGGGSAAQFEATSLLTTKANASSFAVVYPNGTPSGMLGLRTWNAGSCCGGAVTELIDDVAFVRQLVATLGAQYRIDAKRVYATGHSNGGMLSHRLACEASDRIAAIAPHAAALVAPACNPARAVPVLHIHSKLDQNVPLAGGVGVGPSGVSYPPMSTATQRWTTVNRCGSASTTTSGAGGLWSREVWSGCTGGAHVELLLTEDGGHAWAGGLAGSAVGDTPSAAISANDELWAFFQRYALP